jgi:hypothetical protein
MNNPHNLHGAREAKVDQVAPHGKEAERFVGQSLPQMSDSWRRRDPPHRGAEPREAPVRGMRRMLVEEGLDLLDVGRRGRREDVPLHLRRALLARRRAARRSTGPTTGRTGGTIGVRWTPCDSGPVLGAGSRVRAPRACPVRRRPTRCAGAATGAQSRMPTHHGERGDAGAAASRDRSETRGAGGEAIARFRARVTRHRVSTPDVPGCPENGWSRLAGCLGGRSEGAGGVGTKGPGPSTARRCPAERPSSPTRSPTMRRSRASPVRRAPSSRRVTAKDRDAEASRRRKRATDRGHAGPNREPNRPSSGRIPAAPPHRASQHLSQEAMQGGEFARVPCTNLLRSRNWTGGGELRFTGGTHVCDEDSLGSRPRGTPHRMR